jgi:hypothetical protein
MPGLPRVAEAACTCLTADIGIYLDVAFGVVIGCGELSQRIHVSDEVPILPPSLSLLPALLQ